MYVDLLYSSWSFIPTHVLMQTSEVITNIDAQRNAFGDEYQSLKKNTVVINQYQHVSVLLCFSVAVINIMT